MQITPEKSLEMYDVSLEEMRPVTQEDIDRLQMAAECGYLLKSIIGNLYIAQPASSPIDWRGRRDRLRRIADFMSKNT